MELYYEKNIKGKNKKVFNLFAMDNTFNRIKVFISQYSGYYMGNIRRENIMLSLKDKETVLLFCLTTSV